MTLLANKAVAAAYNKLGRINDLLNGPDPRFVSYRENGKDKKIENIDLDAAHCHSFIGKMKIDGTWTYSEDVIIAMLKYFFDHTKKWEKVVIELANKVSELLNGEESMEGNMKYDEQKGRILELAKEINKKRLNDIEIVDIQDNNKRLFEVLNNEWITWLDGWSNMPNLQQTFDSLDIAKYIYDVAKRDPMYLEEIKNLKSEESRQISWDSDYYGLIEMAIRINALLHWITLQWWVARQKKYDALLMKHINPYIKDFPLLEEFKKQCWEYLKWETFKWLYFDTKESEVLVNKMDAKKQLQSKTKNALLLALWLGIGVWTTVLWSEYLQSQKQKKVMEETIKEIFENKSATRSGEYGYWEYLGQEKLDKINEYTQKIYDRFVFRYGSIGRFSEKEFKSKIIDCLNNQNLLSELWSEFSYDKIALDDVIIDDYLIPQNIGEFKMNNVPVSPYESLVPYTDEFINTILFEDDFEVKSDSTKKLSDDKRWVNVFSSPILKDIWWFSSKMLWRKSGFSFYKNRFAVVNHKNKRYVVASLPYVDKLDENEVNMYSTSRARDLAVDLLEQTNPILNLLIDQYMMRYRVREERWRYDAQWPAKATIDGKTELFLIKGFLKWWFLENIGKDVNAENKLDKINKINEFLDSFVAENRDIFKKYNDEINPNLTPNGFFQEYEDAMENVITSWDDLSRLPVTDFGKNQTVNHIGTYQTSDGKTYQVGVVEIQWKRYLYADEQWSPNYGNMTYWPYEWGIVARDYIKESRAVIKDMLNIYLLRYYGWDKPQDIYNSIEELFISDLVKRWWVKKIDAKQLMDKQDKEHWMLSQIDEFVLRNYEELKRRNLYEDNIKNKEFTPNGYLYGYEWSMQKTLEDQEKIVHMYRNPSGVLILTNKIGEYLSSDGEKYNILNININGVNYIGANKKSDLEVGKQMDYITTGVVVIKDYYKTKAQFLQKKILLEKKLKSASQRHRDIPIK